MLPTVEVYRYRGTVRLMTQSGLSMLGCIGCRCQDLQSWKEPDRWLTAARDVQLSEEQQQSLLALRTACLDKLSK